MSPRKGTYRRFCHLSQDTLVIPNLIQHTFEIAKIVIENDDTPHFVPQCVLHLPPLVQETSLLHIYCRAVPNSTDSGPLVVSSRSNLPFHDKAEDAIMLFNLSYGRLFGTQEDCLTLIVHRRALLTHIPAAHRACAPFCSTREPAPALVEVPWSIWGPLATRLFVESPMRMDFIDTTTGQRAVMLEDRMPTPIIVRDLIHMLCAPLVPWHLQVGNHSRGNGASSFQTEIGCPSRWRAMCSLRVLYSKKMCGRRYPTSRL
jgi:hypothetical protein